MIISIHQPSYLPWIPFIEKALKSDIFVFLDDVQFEKNSEQNRNQIKASSGPIWLTIPVKRKLNTLINQVVIADNQLKWMNNHINSITQNYSKTPYFKQVSKTLFDIIKKNRDDFLSLNLEIDKYFFSLANFDGDVVLSSDLNLKSKNSDRILSICKKLGAKTYMSGIGGKDYLDLEKFRKSNIDIQFQNYNHFEYSQQYMKIGFSPRLSALDFFCNYGLFSHAKEKILSGSSWEI